MSDNKKEIYIKNPLRNRRVPKKDPYVSEYKRMGISPVEFPIGSEDEFLKANKVRKNTESQKVEKSLLQKLRDGEISRDEMQDAIANYREPKVKDPINYKGVGSITGQAHDNLWTEVLQSNEDNENREENLKNEIKSGAVEEDAEYVQQEFFADDVPDPPPSIVDDSAEPETEPKIKFEFESEVEEEPVTESSDNNGDSGLETDGFSFSNVKQDEYVLLYNDSVMAVGTKEYITGVLTNNLIDGSAVEDFVLIKKLNIRMGIFIDE